MTRQRRLGDRGGCPQLREGAPAEAVCHECDEADCALRARRLHDGVAALVRAYELHEGAGRLMLFPRGVYRHPEYGKMTFDEEFFDEILANFDGKVLGETKPFIDVDHNHGAAAGWIQGLRKEPDGLFADVEWTSLGEDLIRSGQYRFFSPWWGQYKDPGTNKTYDRVLRGGGLTNVPFLKVLPAVELAEPGSRAARRLREEGVSFQLSELVHLSGPVLSARPPRRVTPGPVAVARLLGERVRDGLVRVLADHGARA